MVGENSIIVMLLAGLKDINTGDELSPIIRFDIKAVMRHLHKLA